MDIAVNAWFWDQPATGSGQYVRHLLPALTALNSQIRVHPVVPEGTETAPNGLTIHTGGRWRRTTKGGFGHRIANLYKLWFEQVAFPRASAAQHAAVAHVPYFASPAWPTTPTVVTVHDLIPMVLPAYRGSVLVRAYTRLVAAGARRADAVIADSESSKRDIVTHLEVEPERIHVIPLAAGPRFQPAASEEIHRVRPRYGLPNRYVLYLGGFDQRKNLPMLLHAFAQLQDRRPDVADVQLVIAGRPPTADTDFTPDPQRIATQLGIRESVTFPGWIDDEDKPALFSGAELFVFPSVYEGFGLPVLEAMACGTPVVTSNTSSLPEVVGGAGLTVDPSDTDALTRAMTTVLTDEERWRAMQQAGLEQASRFNWEGTAQATLEVYHRVRRAKPEVLGQQA